MAIKKFFINKAVKPGYPYDRKAKKYYSWGFDVWVNGSRLQERGFITKEDAENAVARLKQEAKNAAHGILPPEQIPYLIDLFQKKLDRMEVRAEKVRAKRVFDRLLKPLPADFRVNELRSAHIQEYVHQRKAEGVSDATIRRELVPLSAVLNGASDIFPELESYQPPRITRPQVTRAPKKRVISVAEQNKILEYLFAPRFENEGTREPVTRRRVGQFLQFMLLTGARTGEAAKIRKQDIDLQSGVVRIRGTKTEKTSANPDRYVKIGESMAALLGERMREAKDDYVFTKSGDQASLYRHLKAACEYAGLTYGRAALDGITFYTSRHTSITRLVQGGVDLKTAGALVGHADSTMTLYYSHTRQELLDHAADVLESKIKARSRANSA